MIIALQVYEGDVFIAKELVRLICDIQPEDGCDVPWVISAARGTNRHAVMDMTRMLSEVFSKVSVINGTRFGSGWPNGPNDLWFETMMRLKQRKSDERWVLTIEPDCIPMKSDWIERISREAVKAEESGVMAIGHLHGEPKTHLNGNAIFDIDIVEDLHLDEGDGIGGWDVLNAPKILPHALDTPEICQIYRIRHIKPEKVATIQKNGNRPSLFHGIKGMLGIEGVRWMIANGKFA